MTAFALSTPEKSTDDPGGQLVCCAVAELRPHPALVKLNILPSAQELSVAIGRSGKGNNEPLTITQERYILSGHAQWRVALKAGETKLRCVQLDMTEQEALLWIIRKNQRSHNISDFNRIVLALELEPWLQEKARVNQQAGGQRKGSLNLAEADKLDVRSEIASAAGLSVSNVSKVKRLLGHGAPEILEALREREISIHRAFTWLTTPDDQLVRFRLHQNRAGIKRTSNSLLRRHHQSEPSIGVVLDVRRIGLALAARSIDRTRRVLVSEVQVPGEMLLLSTSLLRALESQGALLQ